MGDELLLYMIEDVRQRNAVNRASSISKGHTYCPTLVHSMSLYKGLGGRRSWIPIKVGLD